MKTCSKCGEAKSLDLFFARSSGSRDGRTSACKACMTAALYDYRRRKPEVARGHVRKYQARNAEALQVKARERYQRDRAGNRTKQRDYYETHAAERSEYNKRFRQETRADRLAYEERYKVSHATQRKARAAVRQAVLSGKLVRPETCSHCGERSKRIQGHHESYERERWLDVIWLCARCHLRVHGVPELRPNLENGTATVVA